MVDDAEGLIVNRSTVGRYFGYSADGVYVNCGSRLIAGFKGTFTFVDVGEVRWVSHDHRDTRRFRGRIWSDGRRRRLS